MQKGVAKSDNENRYSNEDVRNDKRFLLMLICQTIYDYGNPDYQKAYRKNLPPTDSAELTEWERVGLQENRPEYLYHTAKHSIENNQGILLSSGRELSFSDLLVMLNVEPETTIKSIMEDPELAYERATRVITSDRLESSEIPTVPVNQDVRGYAEAEVPF